MQVQKQTALKIFMIIMAMFLLVGCGESVSPIDPVIFEFRSEDLTLDIVRAREQVWVEAFAATEKATFSVLSMYDAVDESYSLLGRDDIDLNNHFIYIERRDFRFEVLFDDFTIDIRASNLSLEQIWEMIREMVE